MIAPRKAFNPWRLSCAFFATLASISILDFALPAAGVRPSGRRYSPSPLNLSWNDLIQGDAAAKLESAIRSRSFLVHETGARFNEGMFAAFGRTSGVHVGKDNWLFVKDRMLEIEAEDLEGRVSEAVRVVDDFRFRCAERGVPLFVVITPDRFRVYPDRAYGGGAIAPNRFAFLPKVASSLGQRGIPVLDLTPTFLREVERGKALHFAVDHHWNFVGSEVAAKSSAAWLHSFLPQIPGSPARDFHRREWLADGSPNRSLITLLKFRKDAGLEKRFLDQQRIVEFSPAWPQLRTVERAAGIKPAGILLQSSFGMFGFPQYLEMALDRRLVTLVQPGRGSLYGPCRFLLDHLPGLDEQPPYAFVLWEIPEYHLFEGLETHGFSRTAGLPHPFLPEEAERLAHVGFAAPKWLLASRKASMRVAFPAEVDLVRVATSVTGGSNRGSVFIRGSDEAARLVLVDFPGPHAYDFRLPRPVKSATVDWEFRDGGVLLSDLRIIGGASETSRADENPCRGVDRGLP